MGTADINAHLDFRHSPTEDHRGTHIADIIQNSTHITLNTDTPTRKPTNAQQQPTSPDITTAPAALSRHMTWNTLHSDHLPILPSYNTKTKFHTHQPQLT